MACIPKNAPHFKKGCQFKCKDLLLKAGLTKNLPYIYKNATLKESVNAVK